MFYNNLQEYKGILIGDKVKIKSKFIPPVAKGFRKIHSRFEEYIKKVENLFTVNRILDLGSWEPLLGVFELTELLEFHQIEKFVTSGKIRIFNWNKKR